jgi:hypothetical protein
MKDNTDVLDAFRNCVITHALPRYTQTIRGGKMLINGWWRSGSSPNVICNIDDGNFTDLKTGDHGIVRDFAQLVDGMDVRAFVDRYARRRVVLPRELPEQEPTTMTDVAMLTKLCAFGGQPGGVVEDWLASRAIDPFDGMEVGQLLEVDLNAWPDRLQSFGAHAFAKHGSLLAFPMHGWDDYGPARNLHLRTPDGAWRRFLPGRKIAPHTIVGDMKTGPLAYGKRMPLSADLLIVVEGAPDQLVAQWLAPPHTHVLGVSSASMFPHWTRVVMKTKTPVLVVGQHDDNGVGQKASGDMLKVLGSRAKALDLSEYDVGDLNDMLIEHGPQKTREALARAAGLPRESFAPTTSTTNGRQS